MSGHQHTNTLTHQHTNKQTNKQAKKSPRTWQKSDLRMVGKQRYVVEKRRTSG
jgi:hypothetical protein